MPNPCHYQARLHRVPEALPAHVAALCEPLSIAVHAVISPKLNLIRVTSPNPFKLDDCPDETCEPLSIAVHAVSSGEPSN